MPAVLLSERRAMPAMSADPAQRGGPLSSANLLLQPVSLCRPARELAVGNPSSRADAIVRVAALRAAIKRSNFLFGEPLCNS